MKDSKPTVKNTNSIQFTRTHKLSIFLLLLALISGAADARSPPNVDVVATEDDFDLRESLLDNDLKVFNELLSRGANPTIRLDDSRYGWVFCAATENGRESFLRSIIRAGYDTNFGQTNISTEISLPLNCAVTFNNLAALKILISAGADPTSEGICPNCSGSARLSALGEAVMIRKYKLATWLLDKGNYSDEQLNFVVRNLEMFIVDESSPINKDRLALAEGLRKMGIEVHPWSKQDNGK